MIDITKKYKTRDGREVTQLVKFEGVESYTPILGVVNGAIYRWREDGKYLNHYCNSDQDLIEVKEPREIYLWISKNLTPLLMKSPHVDPKFYLKYGYELKKFKEVIED